jgi:hypothetical protein
MAVLGLVAPFLIAAPLHRSLKAVETSTGDAERLDRLFASIAKPAKPLAVTVATLAGMLAMLLAAGSGRYVPAASITPEAAVTAALSAGARGPVMNDYNFGGYLIFRGIPVFIDGRAEMYGREFMEKMFEAQRERSTLSRMLAKYGIGWTLLSPGATVTSLLDTMPCWRRVYTDSIAVAHVRVECAPDD